jgi:23S rRNA (guanosine2251-2'-O)-methyltransferase
VSIILRNPHSILATLKSRPKDVLTLALPPGGGGGGSHGDDSDTWAQVEALARAAKVPVRIAHRSTRPGPNNEGDGRTSGAEASIKEKTAIPVETLFSSMERQGEKYGLWLALDQVQDPHNLGAIFRVASFFGVRGIVMTQERSAPLTGTVYDVASGGVENVPFTSQVNLQRAFEVAKKSGLWVLGTSEYAKGDLRSIERDRHWLLVLGNEEKGLRRLTLESCDVTCQIAKLGAVNSLNVSVAAGICIHHLTGAK